MCHKSTYDKPSTVFSYNVVLYLDMNIGSISPPMNNIHHEYHKLNTRTRSSGRPWLALIPNYALYVPPKVLLSTLGSDVT